MTDTSRLANALADRYRIERELGQGGMATVYLAHDLKHDRDVAIKVLHPDLGAALGSERFLSEIKTTARLQHPHILPLLDSGDAGGLLYYVMPLASGETLRARLERERQLPIEDAIRIATEVADALSAAHAIGIVHRDIKPENILLQGGHALVADFGIALAVQQAGGQRMTQTGLSLGTPQYMSPEQAMGERAVDGRSDIYSLGAVTYEMLVGQPPFTGATVQVIVAKVMTEKPTAPSAVRDTVPTSVEHAVLKALAKLPADRFATADKFAEALKDGSPVSRHVGKSVSSPWRVGITLAACLITGIAAYLLGHRGRTQDAPWAAYTQLTDAAGVETGPSLSPDGQSFAYSSNARGTWDIYVQRVGGRNPVLVAGDSAADEVWPAYSPDGSRIAFAKRGDGIFVVGATGESVRRLTTFGSNPAWSPDGRQIVFGTEEVQTPYNVVGVGRLFVVNASGGEPQALMALGPADADQPAWSPSGKRIAFWTSAGGQRDIATIPAAGGPPVKVTDDPALDWAPVWSPDGRYLYFASDRGGAMGIWRIVIDEGSGRPSGAPEALVSGVDADMDLPHLSSDGSTLVFRSKIESVNPAAIAFDPVAGRAGAVTLLQHRTGVLAPGDVSPDGQWVVLTSVPDRRQDLFLMHPNGSGLVRLTDDEARDWFPRFNADGAAVTFMSNPTGRYQSYLLRVDGSGRTQLTDLVNDDVNGGAMAPDGKRLLVTHGPKAINATVSGPWPVTNKGLTPLRGTELEGGSLWGNYWSRDGRWISGFVVGTTGEPVGHAVYEVAAERTRQLNSDSRSYELAWLPDFRHVVYFTNRGELVLQDVVTLERRVIPVKLPYPPDQLASITASPDGRTLFYGARQVEANIWLVKRTAPASTAP